MGIHPLPNEDLVNLPNWLVLKLRIEGDEPFRLADVELLSYRHELRRPQRAGGPRADASATGRDARPACAAAAS